MARQNELEFRVGSVGFDLVYLFPKWCGLGTGLRFKVVGFGLQAVPTPNTPCTPKLRQQGAELPMPSASRAPSGYIEELALHPNQNPKCCTGMFSPLLYCIRHSVLDTLISIPRTLHSILY